jgi:hypothetical protein
MDWVAETFSSKYEAMPCQMPPTAMAQTMP